MNNTSFAGFLHTDEKGRVSLPKPVRAALGLEAGSTLAFVKLGDAIVLIPQDAHLEQVMAAAAAALARAHISVEDMLAGLPEAREQVVREHYGEDVLRALELAREEQIRAGA
jgi:antitoxin PrlF